LLGHTIGVTADRRWAEQAELLRRRGAEVLHGPAIATLYLASDDRLKAATDAVITHPPDYLVATTGIGMRAWFEAAQSWGVSESLLAALSPARLVARGPKAAAAATSAGLSVWTRAESEQLDEVIEILRGQPLAHRRVAVQQYGEEAPQLIDALSDRGAEVTVVPVYRWVLPDDTTPALDLIRAACERRLSAITFTTAPAVRNLFAIAAFHGLDEKLRGAFNDSVAAACIGPVCAASARQLGVERPLEPAVGRLGLMVRALVEHLSEHRDVLQIAGCEVVRQGSSVVVDGDVVDLPPRELAVFSLLAERPGFIVPKSVLLKKVWGSSAADPHLLQASITRLRRRLGKVGSAIRPVQGRGYQLDVRTGTSE
jgi:uroporphyrinogen-III synthase